MGLELEVKYRATPAQQEAMRQAFPVQWNMLEMETTYYDTPGNTLSGRRFTLRRRLENGISICALKTPGDGFGRGEWEVEAATIETAIPALCKLGAPGELEELTAAGVISICGARFTRYAAMVVLEDAEAELALDSGILFAGKRQTPLCEIEVEWKCGSQASVLAFAKGLEEQYSLVLEQDSKFRRALDLRKEAEYGTAE